MNILHEIHCITIKKWFQLSFLAFSQAGMGTSCTVDDSISGNIEVFSKDTPFDTVTIPGLIGVDFKDMDTTYLNEISVSPGLIEVIHDPVELQDFYSSSNTKAGIKKVHSPEEAYNQLIQLDTGLISKIQYWTMFEDYYIFSIIPGIESDTSWNFSFFAIYYIQKGDSTYRFVTFKYRMTKDEYTFN